MVSSAAMGVWSDGTSRCSTSDASGAGDNGLKEPEINEIYLITYRRASAKKENRKLVLVSMSVIYLFETDNFLYVSIIRSREIP